MSNELRRLLNECWKYSNVTLELAEIQKISDKKCFIIYANNTQKRICDLEPLRVIERKAEE